MNAERKSVRSRIFASCILLVMVVLAVCTVTFTTMAEEDNSSYSLIIKKVFDFEKNKPIPEEVQTAAMQREYRFLISGTRRKGDETVPVNETFTLPRMENGVPVWESKVYRSEGPFNVTVTELTDNVDIKDSKGRHYNMSDSTTDTSVSINGRKHEVQLKDNSALIVERPFNDDGPDKLWYRVTSRPYEDHSDGGFEALDETFSLTKGESKRIAVMQETGHMLFAGIYAIEQIAAPDGYQLQLGTRTETVTDGNKGYFYINGTPGSLKLTAGGTKGDGATHIFTIERTEAGDDTEYKSRSETIASGESRVFDNLPKGGYTVTEYSFTGDANTAFSVKTLQAKANGKQRGGYVAIKDKMGSKDWINFSYRTDTDHTTAFFTLDTFGPLYTLDNAVRKKVTDSKITYTLQYAWMTRKEVDGEEKNERIYSTAGTYPATTVKSFNGPKRYSTNSRIYFRTPMLSNAAVAKYLYVKWTEYYEESVTKDYSEAGKTYADIRVDKHDTDPGWMEITAPAPRAGSDTSHIFYYYTLKNSKGKLITGVGGTTDKPDTTTVMLQAGEKVKLTGLTEGSYTITETVDWHHVGFTMEISGYPFGTTEAGKQMDVKVGGQRELTISKPAVSNPPRDAKDDRIYTFSVTGSGFSTEVKLKAGESGKVTLPAAGSYAIKPQNDMLNSYNMKYSDSSAVYGTASGSQGSITFANVFSPGDFGYRYVHEYYVKETDGSYSFVGSSQISTRLGREGGEHYRAGQIDKAPEHGGNFYEHFGEAYGRVDPITPAVTEQEDSDKKALQDTDKEEASDTSDDESPDPDGEEDPDAPDDEDPDVPDDEDPDAPDNEDPDAPDDEDPDAPDNEDPDAPDDEDPDTAGGEDSDTPDDGKPDSSDKDALGSAEEEGNRSIKQAEASDQTASDPVDNGETGTPEEDAPKPDEGGEPETPGGEDPKPDEGGEPETPGGEDPKPDEGGEPEKPGGEDPKPDEGGEPETPEEEDPESLSENSLKRPLNSEEKTEAPKPLSEPSYDNTGVIDKGVARDSNGNPLNYEPEDGKDYVEVTKNVDQIIILRYCRERQPLGKYNVIHVYYRRDENGDTWEGTSGVRLMDGELDIRYTGEQVEKETSFQPEDANKAYTYEWDGRPQYGEVNLTGNTEGSGEFAGEGKVYRPNSAWTSVQGTKEGDQIIILRYFREPAKEGQYNIVHEYYLREKNETDTSGTGNTARALNEATETEGEGEDVSDIFQGTLNKSDGFFYTYEGGYAGMKHIIAPRDSVHTATEEDRKLEYDGNDYTYIDAGYGTLFGQSYDYSCNPNQQWAVATENGDEVIILRYYRKAGYKFVHEYYVRDKAGAEPKLVGKSEIQGVTDVSDEEPYTQEDVTKVPDFQGKTYTYFDCGYGTVSGEAYSEDSGKQYVEATSREDQIIILRYVLEKAAGNPQTPPTSPDISRKPSGSRIPAAAPVSSVSAEQDHQEKSRQEQEAVGPGGMPQTGDDSRTALWLILAAGSLCGLAAVRVRGRFCRKRKEQQTDQ